MSHEHYFIDVSHIDRLDVYRLLDLFKVTCPVAQHIVKKALAAGQRGHKDTRRDWQDIADSAARRLQMMDEDLAAAKAKGCVPAKPRPINDPRTVAGVDVSFPTEKHMNFAPECQHVFRDSHLFQLGSKGQHLGVQICVLCDAPKVEDEHE